MTPILVLMEERQLNVLQWMSGRLVELVLAAELQQDASSLSPSPSQLTQVEDEWPGNGYG
jgi:hypothetical protein